MTRRLAVAALVLLPLVGAACGGSDEPSEPAAAGHVNVVDNRFDPKEISVAVGDTVTWDFKGQVSHNVVGPGFTSKIQRDGTFEHAFNSAGEYAYVCTLHAGMKGTVVVE
jgi:plastocyanin